MLSILRNLGSVLKTNKEQKHHLTPCPVASSRTQRVGLSTLSGQVLTHLLLNFPGDT